MYHKHAAGNSTCLDHLQQLQDVGIAAWWRGGMVAQWCGAVMRAMMRAVWVGNVLPVRQLGGMVVRLKRRVVWRLFGRDILVRSGVAQLKRVGAARHFSCCGVPGGV